VVELETTRKRSLLSAPQRDRLRKRATTVQETLDNEATLYFANLTMGTPAQSLRLDIDTGSSDLWTNSASSDLCQQYSQECATSGTYKANSSSSYSYVNSLFQIKYADGSYAIGDYATDTLHFGGQDITGMQFGIGYNSTSPQGILGVGYTTNEASISTTGKTYNNLPQMMVNQKLTNTAAYSLWLNDLDANTGSILFGGVDSDKYHGELATVPIIKESGAYREFIVGLSSVTAANQVIFNSPIPVLLDSGSSLSYLPTNYAEAIFKIFDATYDNNAGAAVVNCNMMNSASTVDFSFSGAKISVPMNELVIVDGYHRGTAVCILGKLITIHTWTTSIC
jgi:Eukaryotic aspartyl protease